MKFQLLRNRQCPRGPLHLERSVWPAAGADSAAHCLALALEPHTRRGNHTNRSRFCPRSYGSSSSRASSSHPPPDVLPATTACPKSREQRSLTGRRLGRVLVLVRLVRHADDFEGNAHVPPAHASVVVAITKVVTAHAFAQGRYTTMERDLHGRTIITAAYHLDPVGRLIGHTPLREPSPRKGMLLREVPQVAAASGRGDLVHEYASIWNVFSRKDVAVEKGDRRRRARGFWSSRSRSSRLLREFKFKLLCHFNHEIIISIPDIFQPANVDDLKEVYLVQELISILLRRSATTIVKPSYIRLFGY
ncbi:hypothetical protein BC827DRAFT_1265483 [Russula dissimulans]|nr:hypothetical protein BC827DRAFT_1265483 [Russula dissimulans]